MHIYSFILDSSLQTLVAFGLSKLKWSHRGHDLLQVKQMCFKLKCISKPRVVSEYGMRKVETHMTSSLCSKGVQRMLGRLSNLKLSLKFFGSGEPILILSVSILLLSVNTVKCLINVGSTSQKNPSLDMSGIDTRLHCTEPDWSP